MYPHEKGLKAWFGPILAFVPLRPEDIKIILNSEDCQDKPSILYNKLFTYGLISMNGSKYKTQRKAILPLFFPKALQHFLPKFDDLVNNFLVEFDSNLKEEAFDFKYEATDFVLNANLLSNFGVNVDKNARKNFLIASER